MVVESPGLLRDYDGIDVTWNFLTNEFFYMNGLILSGLKEGEMKHRFFFLKIKTKFHLPHTFTHKISEAKRKKYKIYSYSIPSYNNKLSKQKD